MVADRAFAVLPAGATVAVAMSGGVDSSVAAARCVAAGVRTIGITLAMWPRTREIERDRGCCSVDAVDDARRVAQTLGIPHYAWNLEAEFDAAVISDFAAEYAAGRTPNPCVRCNERVKFGTLLERAQAAGATHLATGHYARLGRRGDTVTLHRGADPRKDQGYTLHRLRQAALRHTLLPLGDVTDKRALREEAERGGLITARKPDSQELCFVESTVREELAVRLAGRFTPGPIRGRDGMVVGEHRGLPFYTVGQRSGLGVLPVRPDAEPLFVTALDAQTNTVTVGERSDLLCATVLADGCSWVAGEAPPAGREVTVQLRAHGTPHRARVVSAQAAALELRCDPPVAQVSPGQAAVLYDGDEVLGGGLVCGSRR